jgi:DNA-binding Lrp family transcriptional regulator
MERHRVNQREFSKRAGLNESTVSKILNWHLTFVLEDTQAALAKTIGCSTDAVWKAIRKSRDMVALKAATAEATNV